MSPTERDGQTDAVTELAGEATVDSPPSERDSEDGENGLEADVRDALTLPGPTYVIDAGDDAGTPAART